jgi:hypothetical protein
MLWCGSSTDYAFCKHDKEVKFISDELLQEEQYEHGQGKREGIQKDKNVSSCSVHVITINVYNFLFGRGFRDRPSASGICV